MSEQEDGDAIDVPGIEISLLVLLFRAVKLVDMSFLVADDSIQSPALVADGMV